MSQKEAEILLNRYRQGMCTPEEIARLDRWFLELGQDLPPLQFADELERQRVQQRMIRRVHREIQNRGKRLMTGQPRTKQFHWRAAAAAVFVLASLASLGLLLRGQGAGFAHSYKEVVISTSAGEHKRFKLPDGSVVFMNGNTSLRFQKGFSSDDRVLHLNGEAYFEVVKDPGRPFTVWSAGIGTTALGTSFNINASNPSEIKVSLLTGKVQVHPKPADGEKSWLLLPGQQLTFHTKDQSGDVSAFETKNALAWREGNLYFENEPLALVLRQVGQQYHVPIRYNEKTMKNCRVTTRLDRTHSVQEVLRILSFSHHLNVRHVADYYVVTSPGCP